MYFLKLLKFLAYWVFLIHFCIIEVVNNAALSKMWNALAHIHIISIIFFINTLKTWNNRRAIEIQKNLRIFTLRALRVPHFSSSVDTRVFSLTVLSVIAPQSVSSWWNNVSACRNNDDSCRKAFWKLIVYISWSICLLILLSVCLCLSDNL